MIGFHGQRRVIDLNDGRIQQRVTVKTPEERKFWKDLYPEGQTFRACFIHAMTILPNATHKEMLIFQSPEERKQFELTFIQREDFEHYAQWESDNVLILGCRPIALPEGAPAPVAPPVNLEEEWRKLSDGKLRAAAAELDLPNIDPAEGRELLISRMKRWMKEHPLETAHV